MSLKGFASSATKEEVMEVAVGEVPPARIWRKKKKMEVRGRKIAVEAAVAGTAAVALNDSLNFHPNWISWDPIQTLQTTRAAREGRIDTTPRRALTGKLYTRISLFIVFYMYVMNAVWLFLPPLAGLHHY
jgi:hypothetical protein